MRDFVQIFNNDPTPTTTIGTTHKIHLHQNALFRMRPYRYSFDKRHALDEKLQEMLETGIMEPSTSKYASAIVMVKRDDKYRFYVDFRKLNELTYDEAAPLPIINQTIRDLGDATVFNSIDLKSGYWQIPLETESIPLTAFATSDGGL